MFGMGFFEILLVAIIAVIALGPEKLPTAMVDIAKFLKKFKSGIEDAKSSLDNELNISEMKAEANKFKAQIEDAKSTLSVPDIDLGMNDILNDDLVGDTTKKIKEKKVTVEKKISVEEKVSIKDKEIKKEKKISSKKEKKNTSSTDKFKVKQEEQDK